MLSRSARVEHPGHHAVRRGRLCADRKTQQLLSAGVARPPARRCAGDATRARTAVAAFGVKTMATRAEILEALGLWPLWRQRPDFWSSSSSTTPIAEKSATFRSDRADDDDMRRARIAALSWQAFAADVDGCIACELCRSRNKSVPGVGDTHAKWLFVGEAPGAEEDAKGEPFVGQAGRLLDNMLAALNLARGRDVYIANVLKCRPPNNRTPTPLEAEACRPYLDRQITLL